MLRQQWLTARNLNEDLQNGEHLTGLADLTWPKGFPSEGKCDAVMDLEPLEL